MRKFITVKTPDGCDVALDIDNIIGFRTKDAGVKTLIAINDPATGRYSELEVNQTFDQVTTQLRHVALFG